MRTKGNQLTDNEVREIKTELKVNGFTIEKCEELGIKYNVRYHSIYNIALKKTYKHIKINYE